MRSLLSRAATSIGVAILVTACSSSASPSPAAPSTTPPPARTSAPATPAPTQPPTPKAITPANTAIAAGYEHSCALTSNGGVMCWGSNGNGQLGNGSSGEGAGSRPVEVSGLARGVSAIAAGGSHTCALTNEGGVKCWGYNLYGQLGDGTNTDSSVPVDVTSLASGVTAISVGWSSTCAVTSTGGAKCWGNNPFGGLGNGTRTDSSVPVDVVGLASGVTAISAGTLHACALTKSGGVTCWGDGQSADPSDAHTSVPVAVPGLESGVSAIAAGNYSTCAITTDGGVTCWGPSYATGPDGNPIADRLVSVDVSRLSGRVVAIATGETHNCALTGGGEAACWGGNSYGQLGRGIASVIGESIPVEVAGLGSDVFGIAAGGMHTCALTGGGITCWGFNTHGQLGNVLECSSTSVPVDVPLGADAGNPPASKPIWTPTGRIEHATGSTDVLLRYDIGPDVGLSELGGEQFNPGPEFTLYGDGTVVFRDESAPLPPAEKPVVRTHPFTIAQLDDDQVQALLLFALGDGGLADACDRYETNDTDSSGSLIFTVRAGGIVKQVNLGGPNPLPESLLADLRDFAGKRGVPTHVYSSDRHWGSLVEATTAIEINLLPDPRDAGIAPWPWPDIAPANFEGRDEGGWIGHPRRVMTPDETAVLGLSDNGGVVQRVYLLGPDKKTVYSFSLWPTAPDDAR